MCGLLDHLASPKTEEDPEMWLAIRNNVYTQTHVYIHTLLQR